jgi:hypothetical protein
MRDDLVLHNFRTVSIWASFKGPSSSTAGIPAAPVSRVRFSITMAARGEKASDVRAERWARTPDSPVASRARPTTGDGAGGVTTGEYRLPLRDSVSFRIAGKLKFRHALDAEI